MKKLLLTLGAVASVAAPVAAVVACSSDDYKEYTGSAVSLSVEAGAKPDYTKLPTTSWYSKVNWDRNLFFFEKGTKALDDVLHATGTKMAIHDEQTNELAGLKKVLLDIVESAPNGLYDGIGTFKIQTTPGHADVSDATALPANSIELMAHDGPYTTIDGAKHELIDHPDAVGKDHPLNIFLEILYIPTDKASKFLDNLNTAVTAFTDHGDIKLSDDEKKVWKVLYVESKKAADAANA